MAFQRNLEFVEFHEFVAEIWNSSFDTGWHHMPSFSFKKNLSNPVRTEGGGTISKKSEICWIPPIPGRILKFRLHCRVALYIPNFCGNKKTEWSSKNCTGNFKEIWNLLNCRNSRWNFEILALLQGGSICLVSLVKIQNDPIRTEGWVAIWSKVDGQRQKILLALLMIFGQQS